MTYSKRLAEFSRFAVVGVAATLIHYGLYYLLLPFLNPTMAYTVGYVVSFVCNYLLSSLFTFRVKLSLHRAVAFLLSHAVNYLVGILLLNVFLWAGVSEQWAPLPVFVLVVPINFLLVRYALKGKLFNHKEVSIEDETDNYHHSSLQ